MQIYTNDTLPGPQALASDILEGNTCIAIEPTNTPLNVHKYDSVTWSDLASSYGFRTVDPQHLMTNHPQLSIIGTVLQAGIYGNLENREYQIKGRYGLAACEAAWFINPSKTDRILIPSIKASKDLDVYASLVVIKYLLEGYWFDNSRGSGFRVLDATKLQRLQMIADNDCFRMHIDVNTNGGLYPTLKKSLKFKLLLIQQIISDDRLDDNIKVELMDTWITYGNHGTWSAYSYQLAKLEIDPIKFAFDDLCETRNREIREEYDTTVENIKKAADHVQMFDKIAVMVIPKGFVTSALTNIVPYFFADHAVIIYEDFMGRGIRKGTIMGQPSEITADFKELVVEYIDQKFGETWGGNNSGIAGSDQQIGTSLTVEQLVEALKATINV
jgi:hypothetical protein